MKIRNIAAATVLTAAGVLLPAGSAFATAPLQCMSSANAHSGDGGYIIGQTSTSCKNDKWVQNQAFMQVYLPHVGYVGYPHQGALDRTKHHAGSTALSNMLPYKATYRVVGKTKVMGYDGHTVEWATVSPPIVENGDDWSAGGDWSRANRLPRASR